MPKDYRYVHKVFPEAARRFHRLCGMVAERLSEVARHEGRPFRNVGTYACEPMVVHQVDRLMVEPGFRLRDIPAEASLRYAAFVWGK